MQFSNGAGFSAQTFTDCCSENDVRIGYIRPSTGSQRLTSNGPTATAERRCSTRTMFSITLPMVRPRFGMADELKVEERPH